MWNWQSKDWRSRCLLRCAKRFLRLATDKINPHLSVVIPVYKAENCLEELYVRLKRTLETIVPNFEILLVEDCGGDGSWQLIEKLAARDPRIKGIQFTRNFGQHYGITAGLDHCSGDWVVVMDCDLQDRPEEIPRLYAKAQEGYEIVLARRGKRQDGVVKRFTSWLFYKVFSYLTDIEYDAQTGNYRIMSRKVVDSFRVMREQLRFFGGLVQWLGFPAASIEVEHAQRLTANLAIRSLSSGSWQAKPLLPIPTSRCVWQ